MKVHDVAIYFVYKPSIESFKRANPAQENLKSEINRINEQIYNLKRLRSSGLSMVHEKQMKELYCENEKKEEKKEETTTIRCSMAKKQKDKSKKNDFKNLCESNSDAAATLKSINRGIQGRPRLEIDIGYSQFFISS
ncbi:unnamed protein product [Lepeophtheirus salmonis]|uniref:(salmon louse) hypothetical protein n=1 Tax=Lepeophtheirus salmonis TaxID=72036 RepID=A0A7R8CW81_LEPSM|nr:unnamed protein product [Lepeophtheirus salmonis]CAF2919727.1 unnamed protein product [Lepeophtheirus salmonis]